MTTFTLMEATSAGRASHWHPRCVSSLPRFLSAWGPRETAAKAHPEQGPDCPRPASQVRAGSLGHVETLQEKISVLQF